MKNINSIIIVGGGSAGWMAASYLNKVLSNKATNIKLIESPDINTIGVGEATVPTIRDFFSTIGISEKELLKNTKATIKSAIKFVDWAHKGDGGYYHPFEAPLFSDGIDIATHWAAEKLKGNSVEKFAHATGILASLCDEQKVSKKSTDRDYDANTLYAYHLDAVAMASYLRKVAIERGVVRIEDTVTEVKLNESGEIAELVTEKSGVHSADLYIDCSGFAGLLIGKALGEEFISYEDELLCNSALTLQTDYSSDDICPMPYTTATAKSAGWMWEIGLTNRIGNGYVYSDKFQTQESAEQEFRAHLGKSAEGLEINKLKMRVGRRSKFWSKNCVAIGLSSGFLEPIESTGLQFIQVGLELLNDYFPSADSTKSESLRDQYNKVLIAKYEDTKDFIVTHYCLSQREDSEFWRYIKNELKISDSLKEQLRLWQYKLPTHSDLKEIGMFGAPNYMYILAGMNHLASSELNQVQSITSDRSVSVLNQMKNFRKRAVEVTQTHRNYIQFIQNKL